MELDSELIRLTKLRRGLEVYGYLYDRLVTTPGAADADMVGMFHSSGRVQQYVATIFADELKAAADQFKEIKALEQALLDKKIAEIRSRGCIVTAA